MSWQRKCGGGLLATIGFLLSPLSWWNDLFINIPIALVVAWPIGYFYPPAFTPSLIIAYWLTNVAGFVLMHKGVEQIADRPKKRYEWRSLAKDVVISFLYTALIVVLVKLHIFSPLKDYFPKNQS